MAFEVLTLAWLLAAPGALPPDVVAINRLNFKIPIRIDPLRRAEMKQLILAASQDQGITWTQEAVATPDQTDFSFFAPRDGVFWFSVVVEDNQGNRQPADLKSASPGQKILVDTHKPIIRIVSADRQGDELVVAWEVQDENLDPASLRLEYRPADAPEMSLWNPVPISQASGQTQFRPNILGKVLVRMQALDLAGNAADVQREVSAAPAGMGMSGATASSSPPPPAPVSPFPVAPVPIPPPGSPPPAVPPGGAAGSPFESVPSATSRYASTPPSAISPTPPLPTAPAPPPMAPSPVIATSAPEEPPSPAVSSAAVPPPASVLPPVQATNKKQIALEYEVTRDGPSKIGAVELWITQDNGQTWRFLCDDPDLQSPITAELPGEGLFGFRLVLKSGAGLSSGPPQPGQMPELRVEVDMRPPEAKLFEPRPDPQKRDALIINWTASDRNLTPTPITLEWAEQRHGPWNKIGDPEQPNSGRHSWALPTGMPHRVYLRLIVRDLAGNLSEAVTQQPILIDLHKPEGRIKGLAGLRQQ